MADKKRKLKAKKSGAGDPTFLFEFELPKINNADPGEVPFMLQAWTSADLSYNVPVCNINGGYPTTSAGETIKVLCSFDTTNQAVKNIIANKNAPLPIKLKLTFYTDPNPDIDGYEITNDANPADGGQVTVIPVPSGSDPNIAYMAEIEYSNTPVLPAHNPNLGATQQVALHFYNTNEADTNVFAKSNGNGNPCTEVAFFSSEPRGVWVLNEVDANTFTIFNTSNNMYLGVNGSRFWWNNTPADNSYNWIFNPVNPSIGLFSIQNVSINTDPDSYLTTNPSTGIMGLGSQTSQWYIHKLSAL